MAEEWGRSNGTNGVSGGSRQRYPLGEWKERITIQKSSLGNDKAGNHVLAWEDHFSCSAFVNSLSGKEYWEAAQINAQKDMYFIIRYCSEVADMDTEHYRILFRGRFMIFLLLITCGIRIGR